MLTPDLRNKTHNKQGPSVDSKKKKRKKKQVNNLPSLNRRLQTTDIIVEHFYFSDSDDVKNERLKYLL